MKTAHLTDPRSAGQRLADDAAATGDWRGFETDAAIDGGGGHSNP